MKKNYYYDVFWYEDDKHENYSSQGFNKLKDAINFYNRFKNDFYGFEITKKKISNDEVIKVIL